MIPFSPYLSDAACAAREQALVCRIAAAGLRDGESVPPRIARMAAEVRAGRLGFVNQPGSSAKPQGQGPARLVARPVPPGLAFGKPEDRLRQPVQRANGVRTDR